MQNPTLYGAAMKYIPRSVFFALALLGILFSMPAEAFEINVTADGAPVHWAEDSVTFHINEEGSPQVPWESYEAAMLSSMTAWNQKDGTMHLIYGGTTTDNIQGYVDADTNVNNVIWEDGLWAYDAEALAITLTTFKRSSGELLDADIIVNGSAYTWGVDGAPTEHDLANSMTHEAGHFVGLGHSTEEQATMYPTAPPGETIKRTLYNDDVRGFLFLYGTGSDTEDWEDVDINQEATDGSYQINNAEIHVKCSTAPVQNVPWQGLTLMVLGALAVLLLRRRQKAAAMLTGVSLAAGLMCASPAEATTLRFVGLEELTLRSDQVLVGEIIAQDSRFEGGVIWTTTEVSVEECWTGSHCRVGETITMRSPGGVVGELEQRVSGVTSWHVGERAVLFLTEVPGYNAFRTLGMAQGALKITNLGGEARARRALEGLALLKSPREVLHGHDLSGTVKVRDLKALVQNVQR